MILSTKRIAAMVSVTPRTTGRASFVLDSIKERAFFEARYCADMPIGSAYYHVGDIAQRVQYALMTGRIHSGAACDLREMTPYRICKLINMLTERVSSWAEMSDDDACAIIRTAIKGVK